MNPVTNIFWNTPQASEYLKEEGRHKAKTLARAQIVLEHNSCGYNPINGSENVELARLVPKGHEDSFSRQVSDHHETVSIKLDKSSFRH